MLIEDYTLIKPLGKGAFGEVYLTSKQSSKEKFATKKIDKKFAQNPKAKKYIDNEIAILKDIDHPNIVKLFDVKETNQHYYLVTEYCNGKSLSDCLELYQDKYNKPFSEEIVQYLMKQIVSAILYLHKKTILHRDLKLDNILVNFEDEKDKRQLNMLKCKVKIIDFGFARYLKKEELAYSTLGSPVNMDPGILNKLNKVEHFNEYGYDEKADIWSLGTLCYEMLIGRNVFDANNMKDLVKKVNKGDYILPKTFSKEAVSFVNGMLQYDSKKRLSAEKLYRHRFLNKRFDQLNKIDLSQIKSKVKGSNIRINSKTNQSIWDVVGDGTCSVVLEECNPEEYIEEGEPIGEKKPTNGETGGNGKSIIVRQPTKHIKLSEKELAQEFMKVFEMVNDDFIFIGPKLIPIIPGDDPDVIKNVTDDNL